MKNVLITGITGMAGSHLADYLLNEVGDVQVHGTYRWRSRMDNVEHLTDKIKLHECDLTDNVNTHQTLKEVKPELIFHLAAQSFVPASWRAPVATITDNIKMQINIFEAVRDLKLDPVIQIACSSEEYGLVYPNEVPITEENPLRPLSPYAVSKVGQDMLGFQYYQSYGLKVVRTRAFNHEGPRRDEVFVTSNFAAQIARIEAGKQEPVIYVGNLNARRDWSDVRDVVRAYWLSAIKGIPGEVYVIASGKARTVKDMLDILLGFTEVQVEIKEDPERIRPSDVDILWGDSTKFRNETGWSPSIPFETTLLDSLNCWRERTG